MPRRGPLDTIVSFKNHAADNIAPQDVLRDHSISSSTTRKHSDAASEFRYALSSSKRKLFDSSSGPD